MYSSILELPTQVRMSLDEDDQKVWMDAYNAQNPQDPESVGEAKKMAWMACLKLPSSFSFDISENAEIVSGSYSDNTLSLTKQGGGSVDIPFDVQSYDYYVTYDRENYGYNAFISMNQVTASALDSSEENVKPISYSG